MRIFWKRILSLLLALSIVFSPIRAYSMEFSTQIAHSSPLFNAQALASRASSSSFLRNWLVSFGSLYLLMRPSSLPNVLEAISPLISLPGLIGTFKRDHLKTLLESSSNAAKYSWSMIRALGIYVELTLLHRSPTLFFESFKRYGMAIIAVSDSLEKFSQLEEVLLAVNEADFLTQSNTLTQEDVLAALEKRVRRLGHNFHGETASKDQLPFDSQPLQRLRHAERALRIWQRIVDLNPSDERLVEEQRKLAVDTAMGLHPTGSPLNSHLHSRSMRWFRMSLQNPFVQLVLTLVLMNIVYGFQLTDYLPGLMIRHSGHMFEGLMEFVMRSRPGSLAMVFGLVTLGVVRYKLVSDLESAERRNARRLIWMVKSASLLLGAAVIFTYFGQPDTDTLHSPVRSASELYSLAHQRPFVEFVWTHYSRHFVQTMTLPEVLAGLAGWLGYLKVGVIPLLWQIIVFYAESTALYPNWSKKTQGAAIQILSLMRQDGFLENIVESTSPNWLRAKALSALGRYRVHPWVRHRLRLSQRIKNPFLSNVISLVHRETSNVAGQIRNLLNVRRYPSPEILAYLSKLLRDPNEDQQFKLEAVMAIARMEGENSPILWNFLRDFWAAATGVRLSIAYEPTMGMHTEEDLRNKFAAVMRAPLLTSAPVLTAAAAFSLIHYPTALVHQRGLSEASDAHRLKTLQERSVLSHRLATLADPLELIEIFDSFIWGYPSNGNRISQPDKTSAVRKSVQRLLEGWPLENVLEKMESENHVYFLRFENGKQLVDREGVIRLFHSKFNFSPVQFDTTQDMDAWLQQMARLYDSDALQGEYFEGDGKIQVWLVRKWATSNWPLADYFRADGSTRQGGVPIISRYDWMSRLNNAYRKAGMVTYISPNGVTRYKENERPSDQLARVARAA